MVPSVPPISRDYHTQPKTTIQLIYTPVTSQPRHVVPSNRKTWKTELISMTPLKSRITPSQHSLNPRAWFVCSEREQLGRDTLGNSVVGVHLFTKGNDYQTYQAPSESTLGKQNIFWLFGFWRPLSYLPLSAGADDEPLEWAKASSVKLEEKIK